MKTIRAGAVAGILVVSTMIACSAKFVAFTPLKLQQGRELVLVPAPELLSPEYIGRVKIVLDFYGERYRTGSAGGLLITAKLAKDKELLWNYCNKALDEAYVRQLLDFKASSHPR